VTSGACFLSHVLRIANGPEATESSIFKHYTAIVRGRTKTANSHPVCHLSDEKPDQGFTAALFRERAVCLVWLVLIAAAEYSLIYLLAGGGLFGAILIYLVAKMLGRLQ
jgi:hypothetical protein